MTNRHRTSPIRRAARFGTHGLFAVLALPAVSAATASAAPGETPATGHISCEAAGRACLLAALRDSAGKIDNARWRDQTYRELAKLYAREKQTAEALSLIPLVENADTRAMTIRGIGMEAAKTDMTQGEFAALFASLRAEADRIDHPPSHAIALTYIAMAQAFARDDDGALATASSMENQALRNKAFGETAEIQAERNDLPRALESIGKIDEAAFRDKALRTVSHIFAKGRNFEAALDLAGRIENDYQRSQALLFLLSQQISPEEVSVDDPL